METLLWQLNRGDVFLLKGDLYVFLAHKWNGSILNRVKRLTYLINGKITGVISDGESLMSSGVAVTKVREFEREAVHDESGMGVS